MAPRGPMALGIRSRRHIYLLAPLAKLCVQIRNRYSSYCWDVGSLLDKRLRRMVQQRTDVSPVFIFVNQSLDGGP